MPRAIVSDASCLILLEKIGELEILEAVYTEVIVTSVVASEFGSDLPPWVRIENPSAKSFERQAASRLDPGETTSIALALDLTDPLLIIDDLRGRLVVQAFGIDVTGTLGVFVTAKREWHIDSIKPMLAKIQKTDFRVSAELIKIAIDRAEETG